MDPFVLVEGSNFSFDREYYQELERLKKIIEKNKKRVQRIGKKWDTGQEETITIFATPVRGLFCSSTYHVGGQARTGYIGQVFLPYAAFTYAGDFWNTSNAELILKRDFSRVNFDVIP